MSSAPDRADRGRDLLFGVIALQMSFVDQARFVEVMTLLPARSGTSAEEIFREKGYLAPFQIEALRGLIDAHLRVHGGDVEASLAAWDGDTAVVRSLRLAGARPGGSAPVSGDDGPEGATMVHSRVAAPPAVAPRAGGERYLLGAELGRGGLGRVVLALDRDLLDREVAMKLLHDPTTTPAPGGAGPRGVDRFLEEAHVTSQLQHPNIVAVYDLGTRPTGEPYYTMPVIGGSSLRARIREAHRRLASGETSLDDWGVQRLELLGAFQGLCHGLSYAHARGVIHRDVKPANVMVGEHGETIVVDWGMAKVVRREPEAGDFESSSDIVLERYIRSLRGSSDAATLEGTVAGTPAYMAPEQAAGQIADIDERSDIYALGAVLYEILTGRPPFAGPTREILFRVMAGDVPDPRDAPSRAPVPEDLATVCTKAMSRAKAARHGSVRELLREIVVAIEGSRERERNRARCEEKLVAARRIVEEYHQLQATIVEKQRALAEAAPAVPAWEPLDSPGGAKTELLAGQLELEESRWLARSAFNATLAAFAEALGFDPGNLVARRELAEFHYFHMVRAERTHDPERLEFHRSQVALYNDGDFDARLRGDGRLSIASDPQGAEVRLATYVEDRWFLRAVDERRLGTTPVAPLPLPMGSYLLLLSLPGHRETRVPIVVGRNEDVSLQANLYTDAEIGEGFVHVPAGRFVMGEGREAREVHLDDYFIGRLPVTFGAYCEWLDWLELHAPDEVARRAPQDQLNGLVVRKGADGRYEPFDPDPDPGQGDVISRELSVTSVSWHNAVAYLAWRSERDGRAYRLPTEAEREKASRGADGRTFPWGNRFDATLCRMIDSTPPPPRPVPQGSCPTDESPYGVRDVAGGVRDWCDDWYDERQLWKVVKGSSWGDFWRHSMTSARHWITPGSAFGNYGFRAVVRPGPRRRG